MESFHVASRSLTSVISVLELAMNVFSDLGRGARVRLDCPFTFYLVYYTSATQPDERGMTSRVSKQFALQSDHKELKHKRKLDEKEEKRR